jgi:hypothetical protein
MGAALESACAALGLVNKTDSATELVAQEIIHAAEDGNHDADKLTLAVLRKFLQPGEHG